MLAALVLLCNVVLHAQSGGAAGGDPNLVQCVCDLTAGDASTGCYSTANGVGHRPWSMALVVKVLRPAKDHFGLSLGQMVQVYRDCSCTVTYLGDGYFRVRIGGGELVIGVLDDL